MIFQFATATNVLFGAGVARSAVGIARDFGERALVVTGRNSARAEFLIEGFGRHETEVFSVPGEPQIDTINDGVALARSRKCDIVISIGGGSALDTGKAIAAMLTNPGEVIDYLEIIGGGKTLGNPSAPFIAIPTTAGTGSEVTRNAVLGSSKHRLKVSLRSAIMLPKFAVVDTELTFDLPPAITASTGLDALTQVIEPYVSSRANPITDSLCLEGMRRAARSLRTVFNDGSRREAREDMCVASLFGGMALANAGLGAVHGFAGVIGGMFDAPHGAICGALLPHVMEANVRVLRERAPENPALGRYEAIGALFCGGANAKAYEGVEWVRELVADLKIPPLKAYGLQESDMPEVIEKAAKASSMKGNPIELTPSELRWILERATG